MDKAEFDQLTMLEQIGYINNRIADDESLTVTAIIEELKKSKKILSKYKAAGFEFVREVNRYVRKDEVEHVTEAAPASEALTLEDVIPAPKGHEVVIMSPTPLLDFQIMKEELHAEIKASMESIRRDLIVHSTRDGQVTMVPMAGNINIDYDQFDGDLITRSFRVYKNVLDDFSKFCDDNKKQHKAQALLSQALFEYMQNHK